MLLFTLLLVASFCEGNPHLRRRSHAFSSVPTWAGVRALQQNEEEFIELCTQELTQNDVLEDDIISQVEYANFIVDFCATDATACEAAPTGAEFTSFGLPLQLAFVGIACENISNKTQCLEGFLAMLEGGDEFGYDIGGETLEDVKDKLMRLCSSVFSLVVDPAPTAAPTTTVSETPAPSAAPVPPVNSSSDSLSNGAIAGIAIAAAAVVLAAAFFIKRRRRGKNRALYPPPAEIKSDNSIHTEDSAQLFIDNAVEGAAGDTFDLGGSSEDSEDPRPHAQFSVANAAAIALDTHDDDLSPQDSRQKRVEELDRAIDLGDWEAVYRISGTLSGDDASSQRSFSSSSSKGRSLSHPKDHARASHLQGLVEKGDWDAVAAAAAAFSSGESSVGDSSIFNGSEASSDALLGAAPKDPSSSRFDEGAAKFAEARATEDANAAGQPTETTPRRSFMDFVSGAGTSPAAAAAILDADEEEGLVGASPRETVPAAITSGEEVAAGAAVTTQANEDSKERRSSSRSWKKLFRKRSSQEDFIIDNMESESDSREGMQKASDGHVAFASPGSSDAGEISDMTNTSPDDMTNVSPDLLTAESVGKTWLRSSPISSGTSTPIDPEMADTFERMIAANDWKGLAALAGQEIGREAVNDEDGVSRPEDVNLRPTPRTTTSTPRGEIRRFPSLHGAKVLIPFWEKLIHEVEAEREEKAGLGDLDEHENDLHNEELLKGASPPAATPITPPLSPSSDPAVDSSMASPTEGVASIPVDDGSHTKKTYDAAAAFAKAWNNLKEESEAGEGANDITIAATEWAIKQGAKSDVLSTSNNDTPNAEGHELV